MTPRADGRPRRVDWLCYDSGQVRTLARRVNAYSLPREAVARIRVREQAARQLQFGVRDVLEAHANWRAWADELHSQGSDLLVIDHLLGLSGGAGINNDKDVGPVMVAIKGVADLGIPVILIHHESSKGDPGRGPMGHTSISADWRGWLSLNRNNKSGTTLRFQANDHPSTEGRLSALDGSPVKAGDPKPYPSGAVPPSTTAEVKPKRDRADSSLVYARLVVAARDQIKGTEAGAIEYLNSQGHTVGRQAVRTTKNKGLAAVEGGRWVPGPKFVA